MMVSLGAEVGLFWDFRISEDSTVVCLRAQIVLSLGLISFHFLKFFSSNVDKALRMTRIG
jgi:hypothetical protein